MENKHANHRKTSLLLIYTGGTIGMKQDVNDLTLKPFDFRQILDEVPEIGKFAVKIDSFSFEPPADRFVRCGTYPVGETGISYKGKV